MKLTAPSLLVASVLLLSLFPGIHGDAFRRFHEESEARNVIPRYGPTASPDKDDYDTITLENYLRNYRHGSQREGYMLFTHDIIAAYVGPFPKGHPDEDASLSNSKGIIRSWAMFDKKTGKYCEINGIYDWGQMALFSCRTPGLYRAYAIEIYVKDSLPRAHRIEIKSSRKFVLGWFSRMEKEDFNLLSVLNPRVDVFNLPGSTEIVETAQERMEALVKWSQDEEYDYVDSTGNLVTLPIKPVVVSDPIRIKESYYCYYWMYSFRETSREGYIEDEIIFHAGNPGEPWTSSIIFEVLLWVAEPSGIGATGIKETLDTAGEIYVSEYSRVLTKKFSETGLFPCLRKAHPSIEIVEEIIYFSETDPNSLLHDTPHWRVRIKVHTDRLISTLSDITFTIASRQNSGSFHCFVGDTRVFIRLRAFDFVPMRKLQESDINLNASSVYHHTAQKFIFGAYQVYGHGVQHVGNKWTKRYQPATERTDMLITPNPCIVQEFAISVGGSLYIAEGLLRKGAQQVKKVVLPSFLPDTVKDTERPGNRDFMRVLDVAFTPTHVAFLMAEGYVVLQSSSTSKKGIAEISQTMKYRPDAFVKRRWCPRTASPKLSSMILPIFGEKQGGSLIILQVYPTEGNVPMWVLPPSPSCIPEGAGFIKKVKEITQVINETDIHYDEFRSVTRTNQKTGLVDPPIPSRPPPPPPPDRDIFEENAFVLDSSRNFVVEGEDPHFPLELIDSASRVLENTLKDYNQAKVYVAVDNGEMEALLASNGLTIQTTANVDARITAVEFTSAEKQFVFALTFKATEVINSITLENITDAKPLHAVISTITMTNFPYRVKLDDGENIQNEKLDTVVPFPSTILIRLKHYHVAKGQSRDVIEDEEHSKELQGITKVQFDPELHSLGTSCPAYIINLGDVLVYSNLESRYARPLHYFPWDTIDEAVKDDTRPLFFSDSSIKFAEDDGPLFDIVLTEHGLISVLRRKKLRHLVQDDENCGVTPDTETQKVIMGSVVTLDGLREVKPFSRNDNIFQRGTQDGEIIYGVYDVKPRSSFRVCPSGSTRDDTKNDPEPCVEQPTETLSDRLVPVCTKDYETHDGPCWDPGYLEYCPAANAPVDPKHACLRKNQGCEDKGSRHDEDPYKPPEIVDPAKCDTRDPQVATECLPKHAPREDIRTVNILGTSYHSYLQGSLQSIRTLHPEANTVGDAWKIEIKKEPDLCPFVNFEVDHKRFDFAEVGYQIRVTAQISYIGTKIPVEADLLVDFDRTMGVVVEISTSIEEIRQLTKIVKAVDIHFHLPDYVRTEAKLEQLMTADPADKHRIRQLKHDFEDIRARERFSIFSITFRPSILNTRCKSDEFFKTIQYNVGCNPFSTIRLMDEATTLKRINWTETLEDTSGFKWHRDYDNWNLTIPKLHIFYQQLKRNVFNCDKNPSYCEIPYFHLFKDDIFTISYRDYFVPKFEQFLTVSSRPVSANVVLYDLLGSKGLNWTLNKYKAGCLHVGNYWYEKLLAGTKEINKETFEHENVYLYFRDCFDLEDIEGSENVPDQQLLTDPYYLFNKSNQNSVKFLRNRNEIFIFRAVVMNTYYNRFTFCKQLDTFFLVRITGIPIPRQGLKLWQYVLTILLVMTGFVVWYFIFARFYTWTVSPP